MKRIILALCLVPGCIPLGAAELPPETKAKIIRVIAVSAGLQGKVACHDSAVMAELAKLGFSNDPGAKVAYAASPGELHSFKGGGKLILCPKVDWLAGGAAVAIVEEDGKPQIYFHMANINGSNVPLSDAVLKIGRKL